MGSWPPWCLYNICHTFGYQGCKPLGIMGAFLWVSGVHKLKHISASGRLGVASLICPMGKIF